MDYLLLSLEYVLFTIPVFLIFVLSFRLFVRGKAFERLFYFVAFVVPIASILSLIKVFFIVELGATPTALLPINLTFGLFLLMFGVVTTYLVLGVKGYPNIFEMLGFILLVSVSLILKDSAKALDFFSWGLIGISTIHFVRYFAFSRYSTPRIKREYVVVVIFVTISNLLKLLYYVSFLPLYPTIYISLILMFLGLLHIVFLIRDISQNLPQREIPEDVLKSKVSIFRRIIGLVLVATIILNGLTALSYYEFRQEKTNILINLEEQTAFASSKIYGNFNTYVIDTSENHIRYLAETIDKENLNAAISEVKSFYETHSNYFSSITILSNTGKITYTYPFTYYIGADISSQAHVQKILKEHVEVVSSPFMAVEGFPAIAIYIPVENSKNPSIYAIGGLIDLRRLSQLLSSGIQQNIIYFVLEDGVVVANNFDYKYLLSNDHTIIKSDSFKNFFKKSYSFTYKGHSFEIVALSNPESAQNEIKSAFYRILIFNGSSILIFLISFILLLYALYGSEKELTSKIESELKKEIETLKEYKNLQEKLQILNDFIYESNIEEPPEKFIEKLFFFVKKLIPKVEKGVLWMAEGNKVIPTATYGYDMDVLKKLVLDKDREERFWSVPTIVQKIGITGFPDELKDIARLLSLEEISETLIVPIIVEGHYIGHFSLDIFSKDIHFDDFDVAIAKSISKVLSFYLSTNALLERIKQEVNLNAELATSLQSVIQFVTKAKFTEPYEKFFQELLEFAVKFINGGEKGTVWLVDDNKMKCIAAVSFDKDKLNEYLNISKETEESLARNEPVRIIENITKVGLSEEEQKITHLLNMDDITYTITASFFVDNTYYGGMYIDTTLKENPFTEFDKEFMKAISNFGSLYIQTKKLFTDMESELKVDSLITNISENVRSEMDLNEFLTTLYTLTSKTFPISYIAFSTKFENKFIHILVKENDITSVINDSFEFKEALHSKIDPNYIPVNYEVENSSIKIGISDITLEDVIFQLEVNLLPILKEYFSYKEREKLLADVMVAFAKAIDSKDPYTRLHSENVTKYAFFFGKKLGLDITLLRKLVFAAVLHDVGKIGVREAVLLKEAPLTESEREEIKKHPEKGFEIVNSIEGLKDVAKILRYHHERYDGHGYPDGLKGDEIPYLSRILAIVDAYDVMTADRPYRKAKSSIEAIEEILNMAGAQFDPDLAKKFAELKDEIESATKIDIREIFSYVLKIW